MEIYNFIELAKKSIKLNRQKELRVEKEFGVSLYAYNFMVSEIKTKLTDFYTEYDKELQDFVNKNNSFVITLSNQTEEQFNTRMKVYKDVLNGFNIKTEQTSDVLCNAGYYDYKIIITPEPHKTPIQKLFG